MMTFCAIVRSALNEPLGDQTGRVLLEHISKRNGGPGWTWTSDQSVMSCVTQLADRVTGPHSKYTNFVPKLPT